MLDVGLEDWMLSPFCGSQWTMEPLRRSSGRSRPTFFKSSLTILTVVSGQISEGRHFVEAFSLSKTNRSYLMQLGSVRSWPSQGNFFFDK